MAKRIVTRIGNIFCVEIDKQYKKFFQYVANAMSQLNSSVIRAFKRKYPIEWKPDMAVIVDDDVEFYAHTVLSAGIQKIHGTRWELIKMWEIQTALCSDCIVRHILLI